MADIFDDEGAEFKPSAMARRVTEQLAGEEAIYDDTPEPVQEEEPAEEPEPVEDEQPEEEDAQPEEEAVEDDPEAAEPAQTEEELRIPQKFVDENGNVNIEALAQSYQHLERKLSERSPDTELQQRVAQLEQERQALLEMQRNAAEQNDAAHVEAQILNTIEADSSRAYMIALDGFRNGTLTKDHVDSVIDYVWETGEEARARSMEREFRDELVKQEVKPLVEQSTTAQQQAERNHAIARASQAVEGHIGAEAAQEYAADIAQVVQEMPHLLGDYSEQSAARGILAAYEIAKGRKAASSAEKTAKQAVVREQQKSNKRDAQVLSTGADTPTPTEELTPEEEYQQSVFEHRAEHKKNIDILFGA